MDEHLGMAGAGPLLAGILLAVIAVQPYEVVREALPYVGLVCALIIFWRMRQRRRVAG